MRHTRNLLLLLFGLLLAQANAQTKAPIFRVESNAVLIPTLVTKKSGEIVCGLKAKDFIVYADGVEQDFRLDESPDYETISIIVAVQLGGSAHILFENKQKKPWQSGSVLGGLGTMMENFVGKADSEIAIVTFDSNVNLLQKFTHNLPATLEKLNQLEGSRDRGAAILDAIDYSLQLFADCSPGQRRILFLISETRDHTSRMAKPDVLLKKIAESNIQLYSIAFKPLRLELARDLKERNPTQNKDPSKIDLNPAIRLAVNALAKNTVRPLADHTGGEYYLFSNRSSFDAALGRLANHFRNTYLISFQAKDTRPGSHNLSIRLRNAPSDVVIRARNSYWVGSHD
jgi:VWFA-related protein